MLSHEGWPHSSLSANPHVVYAFIPVNSVLGSPGVPLDAGIESESFMSIYESCTTHHQKRDDKPYMARRWSHPRFVKAKMLAVKHFPKLHVQTIHVLKDAVPSGILAVQ